MTAIKMTLSAYRRSALSPPTLSRRHLGHRRSSHNVSKQECETPSDSKLLNAPRGRGRDDDALSRYPNFQSAGGILRSLDYAGTVTFALTGSVTAAQSGLDVFGCCMIASVTAVGGGTIRDAIFLSKQPFWTSETEYIWMTVAIGLLTFCTWPTVLEWQHSRQKDQGKITPQQYENGERSYDELDATLDTLDAVGLSAFAIVGAQNGVRAGMPMIVSAICGMATSTFGGMTRDVLCGRPVRIVHSNAEVYSLPALSGALTYLIAKRMEATPAIRIGSAFAVCMGSRFVAVKHDVKLHTWDRNNDSLGVEVRK